MALTDDYPDQYAAWVAAGGVEANFRRHLLALGTVPATPRDLLDLAQESLSQAQGLLANLAAQDSQPT